MAKGIIYSLIVYLLFCNNAVGLTQTENGYQLKFNYNDYPKEREIAYQYYLDHEIKSLYIPVGKENIGIDMFDIDGDGVKEIFLFVNGNINGEQYCPRAGCPFAIIKPTNDEKKYTKICWSMKGGVYFIHEGNEPKVLYSKTNGCYDVLMSQNKPEYLTIWSWDGECYQGRGIDEDYKFKTINNNKGE